MLTDILVSSLRLLTAFYITIVLLRFLLQISRADFYNPISQFVVKATNPLLAPLRQVVPGIGGFDGASLVLAVLIQTLVFVIIASLAGAPLHLVTYIAWSAVVVLNLLVQIYFWAAIAMIILSWVAPGSYHPAVQLLHQITEPVMRPFRRLLPPLGGLDLSPILLFLVINVIQIVIARLADAVSLSRFWF